MRWPQPSTRTDKPRIPTALAPPNPPLLATSPPIFLQRALTTAMDKHDREREMTSVLLSALYNEVGGGPSVLVPCSVRWVVGPALVPCSVRWASLSTCVQ